MDENYFGAEIVEKYLGVECLQKDFPFSEKTLKKHRETHVSIVIPSLSILELQALFPCFFYGKKDAWYRSQQFAQNRSEAEAKLIRKSTIKNSLSKTLSEQQLLLSSKEEISDARNIVFATILYFLVTEKRLFSKTYLRCKDVDSFGDRIVVGDFSPLGFCIGGERDSFQFPHLGIATEIKPENLKA